MAEHDGQTINVGDVPWVRFDPTKPATWPPVNQLVLLNDSRCGYTLGSWEPGSESPEYRGLLDPLAPDGGGWYDENSDYDDGWEPNDERWWRPLPPPPAPEPTWSLPLEDAIRRIEADG